MNRHVPLTTAGTPIRTVTTGRYSSTAVVAAAARGAPVTIPEPTVFTPPVSHFKYRRPHSHHLHLAWKQLELR
jgi:hypothetical protein